MGKSRLLDEFSKHFFMIPINLRSSDSKGSFIPVTFRACLTCLIGYPPPDHIVRDFLTGGGIEPQDVSCRIGNFLIALLEVTKEVIPELGDDQFTRIKGFREFMSKDQHMESAGSLRIGFYKKVVALAETVSQRIFSLFCMPYPLFSKLGNPEEHLGDADRHRDPSLTRKLENLRNALNEDATGSSQPEEPRRYPGYISTTERSKGSKFVDIFIAFDEAHTLARTMNTANESCFVVLRRMLSSLLSQPLYSFFLSTTGNITQFAQPRGQDSSNRINSGVLSTPRPYIYLGFDQLMQNRKVFQRWKTLEDVTSLECAAHMGRPL